MSETIKIIEEHTQDRKWKKSPPIGPLGMLTRNYYFVNFRGAHKVRKDPT